MVKIVRALWGDINQFIDEIPKKPKYDEMVYVWGVENNEYLKKCGYNTTLINVTNIIFSQILFFSLTAR